MRRLLDTLAAKRWLLPVLAFAGAILPLAVVSPDGASPRWLLLTAIALLVPLLVILGVNLSGRDTDAVRRARTVVAEPVAVALLSRWLRRSRHFRFVGGLAGAIVGASFADGSLVPVLVWMLAGIAIGGALAEVHSLRRGPGRRAEPRTVDITVRRLADYAPRIDLLALGIVGGVAGAILVAMAVGVDAGRAPAPAASLALATVAAVVTMQWSVVVRARPALAPELRQADDLMRRLAASQGFARPGIALAVALLARALSGMGPGRQWPALVILLGLVALAWYAASRQSRSNLLAAVRP